MSLKTVFWLMGLVTSLMIAGVVYTKVLRDPVLTVGEQRALDRVCDTRCAGLAEETSKRITDPAALEAYARDCVQQCRARMYAGRVGGAVPGSLPVDAPGAAPGTRTGTPAGEAVGAPPGSAPATSI